MLHELVLLAFCAIILHDEILLRLFKIRTSPTELNRPFLILTIATLFITSLLNWTIYTTLLKPLQLDFLRVLVCITVILATAQGLLVFTRNAIPQRSHCFAHFAPLMALNTAVLGTSLFITHTIDNINAALTLSIKSTLIFAALSILFHHIRQRLQLADIPTPFQGTAIHMITAGLIALALMGLAGIIS